MVRAARCGLWLEALEDRFLLATVWTNEDVYADVNKDGFLTPADPLTVVNCLNEDISGEKCACTDVNRSGETTPVDVIIPVNRLNAENERPDYAVQAITNEDSTALVIEVSEANGIHSISVDAQGSFTVLSPTGFKDGKRHVVLRFDFASPLADGQHNVALSVVDARGDSSGHHQPIIVDTAPPQALLVPQSDDGAGGAGAGEAEAADPLGSEFYLLLSEPLSASVFQPSSYLVDNGTGTPSNSVQSIDTVPGFARVALFTLAQPLADEEVVEVADDAFIFDAAGNPLTELTLVEAEVDPDDWESTLDDLFASLGSP